MKNMKGNLQIYTGDGKGKTTAAMGLAVRAGGAGFRVIIFQFFKFGNFDTGEIAVLSQFKNIKLKKFKQHSPLFDKTADMKILKKRVVADFDSAVKEIMTNKYYMAIFDELTYAFLFKFLNIEKTVKKLKKCAKNTEIIITGRNAPKGLQKAADLITEMKEVKHYYKKGVKARKGIVIAIVST